MCVCACVCAMVNPGSNRRLLRRLIVLQFFLGNLPQVPAQPKIAPPRRVCKESQGNSLTAAFEDVLVRPAPLALTLRVPCLRRPT